MHFCVALSRIVFGVVSVTLLSWLFCVVIPERTPAVWDEADYMMGTLELHDLICSKPWQVLVVPFDIRYSLSHRSLVASLVTIPLLRILGRHYETFFISATLITIATTLLMGWSSRYLADDPDEGAMCASFAMICFALSPVVVLSSGMYLAEAPWALVLGLAFWSYLRARTTQRTAHWYIAGILLALSIYARAERGVNVIAVMQLMFLVDTCFLKGWRTGLQCALVQAGVAAAAFLGTVLWTSDFLPPFMTVCAAIVALITVIPVFSFVRQKCVSVKPVLIYAGIPALVVTLILLCGDNASRFCDTLRMFMSVNAAHEKLFAYPFLSRYATQLFGSHSAFALFGVLALVGLYRSYRTWPGLLAFLIANVLTYARLHPSVDARYLWQFHFGVCFLCGLGAIQVWQLLVHIPARKSGALYRNGSAALLICMALFLQWQHLFERAKTVFEFTFDATRTLHSVLDHARKTIPKGSDISVVPYIRGFEASSVQAYSALHALKWTHVIMWPSNNTLIVLHDSYRTKNQWPRYVINLLPGDDVITARPATVKDLNEAHAVMTSAAQYWLMSSLTTAPGRAIVHIYAHTNVPSNVCVAEGNADQPTPLHH